MPNPPYIPNVGFEQDSSFSKKDADDLRVHLRLLEERWRLFYPVIPWYQILFLPTSPAQPPTSEAPVVGLNTGTLVDDLYGEAVPQKSTGVYQQPHTTPTMFDSAPERRKHANPVSLNVFVRREETENELTPFGEDASRILVATLLTSLCDARGVTVNVGDEFEYGGQRWEVNSARVPERARWKTTNIPLFIECKCFTKRVGS